MLSLVRVLFFSLLFESGPCLYPGQVEHRARETTMSVRKPS